MTMLVCVCVSGEGSAMGGTAGGEHCVCGSDFNLTKFLTGRKVLVTKVLSKAFPELYIIQCVYGLSMITFLI